MAEGDRRTKDIWDIVEVIGKSVLAIGVTGGITFYGISVNSRLADEETARVKRRAFQNETYWGKPVPGFGDPRARLLLANVRLCYSVHLDGGH